MKEMTKLAIEKNRLVLHVENEPKLQNGMEKSILMFDRGFEFSEKDQKYILSPDKNLEEEVRYVVDFLSDEKIPHTLDADVERIYLQHKETIRQLVRDLDQGRKIKEKKRTSEALPKGFTKPLLLPQRRAVALHTSLPYSADFSVPGSGKTWIGYATYVFYKNKSIVDRLLIVGPISSFQPWQDEYQIIFEKRPRCLEIKGTQESRIRAYKSYDEYELFLMSYHSLANDEEHIANMLTKRKFMVILDESHNIKQIQAKRTRTVLRLAELCKRRMLLSGTPIPRSVEDLYTQFSFLDPSRSILGDYNDFTATTNEEESFEILKERISAFYFRIRKADLEPKLPRTVFFKEFLNMDTGRVTNEKGQELDKLEPCPNQSSIYYAIEGRIYKMYEKEKSLKLDWQEYSELQKWQRNRLMRLMQVASNPALLLQEDLQLASEKINSAGLPIYKRIKEYGSLNEQPIKLQRAEILARRELEISPKRKIILWTSFVQNIRELKKRLREYDPAIVYGDIPKDENENQYFNRLQQVSKFKNDKDCRLIIGNPASLAESVSLHKNLKGEVVCDTAIYLDRTFNGAHYMQSLDRIHRIGLPSDREVRYFLLQTADTVDLDIDDSLEIKVQNMSSFLNDDIRKFNLDTKYEDITDGVSDKNDYQRVMRRLEEHAEKGKFD